MSDKTWKEYWHPDSGILGAAVFVFVMIFCGMMIRVGWEIMGGIFK